MLQLKSADGSSQGGSTASGPRRYAPRGPVRGSRGLSNGADVKQPLPPERPPTVALSGMSLAAQPGAQGERLLPAQFAVSMGREKSMSCSRRCRSKHEAAEINQEGTCVRH